MNWRATSRAVLGCLAISSIVSFAEAQGATTRAKQFTLQLELEESQRALVGLDQNDAQTKLEQGRRLLYGTDYDRAFVELSDPEVLKMPEGAQLAALSGDCVRSMAGAFVIRDEVRGVIVRMQDDHDRALVPLLIDVAVKARDSISKDLGVQLPRPLRIELLRDHFALSAMTGLPEKSARTTGTVAVANWGRVAMLSPRSMPGGYPWMDTLAHEMTHLALGRGTTDKAPLWLQEGVAKFEETRWRARDESDDQPSADSLAAVGFDRGIALDFNKLGPSVAMLPTPQQAMVVFAEVQSFVSFWVHEQGDGALPKLVDAIRKASDGQDIGDIFREVSRFRLEEWVEKWKRYLENVSRELPEEIDLGGGSRRSDPSKLMRNSRLGSLLLDEGFNAEAVIALEKAQYLAPRDLRLRFWLGKSYLALGRGDDAFGQLQKLEPGASPEASAFALRGHLFVQRGGQTDQVSAEASFFRAISLDPWDEKVACHWLSPPTVPPEETVAKLCEASRVWPRN